MLLADNRPRLLPFRVGVTAAHFGQLNKARELSRQAVTTADRAGRKDRAAGCQATSTLREALLGNAAEAKRTATSVSKSSSAQEVQFLTALALATVGDQVQAVRLADLLKSHFPEDTIVQFNYLPAI